jgi:putative addiction module killer protein
MPQVREYQDNNGRNHYREFFNALGPVAAAKVTTIKYRLEDGNTSGLKGLGGGLAEWRLDWGPGIRIYVYQDGGKLLLLLAGSDKSDQAKTITLAHGLVDEIKANKKDAEKAAAAKVTKRGKTTKKS